MDLVSASQPSSAASFRFLTHVPASNLTHSLSGLYTRAWQSFSLKCQMVNIIGLWVMQFLSQLLNSVQLCCCRPKAAIIPKQMGMVVCQ